MLIIFYQNLINYIMDATRISIYLFKDHDGHISAIQEICSKLTIKTSERRY